MNLNDNIENMHTKIWCAIDEPYPEIKIIGPNNFYAQLLLEDYAGAAGELTAINQYFHHHIMFEGQYDELAKMEECIAVVEMYHMELLAETIKMLGVDPQMRIIRNNQSIFWNASYVYYGNSLCDRLAADVEAEKKAIRQYQNHIRQIDDPYIKKLLERIIRDEQHHAEMFINAYRKYCVAPTSKKYY